jgi:hypothetical protein
VSGRQSARPNCCCDVDPTLTLRTMCCPWPQILLVEGLQALWFVTAVLDLYSPHLCRRISGQMTRLGCMFTQDPRYGTLRCVA